MPLESQCQTQNAILSSHTSHISERELDHLRSLELREDQRLQPPKISAPVKTSLRQPSPLAWRILGCSLLTKFLWSRWISCGSAPSASFHHLPTNFLLKSTSKRREVISGPNASTPLWMLNFSDYHTWLYLSCSCRAHHLHQRPLWATLHWLRDLLLDPTYWNLGSLQQNHGTAAQRRRLPLPPRSQPHTCFCKLLECDEICSPKCWSDLDGLPPGPSRLARQSSMPGCRPSHWTAIRSIPLNTAQSCIWDHHNPSLDGRPGC